MTVAAKITNRHSQTPAKTQSSVHSHGLKQAVLTPLETLGQSVAGIAPSATPGMLIPIVFSFAGNGTWLSYLIATIGIIFTAQCINEFTSRSACPGSLYSFVSQELGQRAGMLTGWALMFAYVFCGAACATEVAVYISSLTKHLAGIEANNFLMITGSTLLVAYVAYKNIKMSASLMLRLEFLSMGLIIFLVAFMLCKFGFKLDPQQLNLTGVQPENVRMGLVMSIFGFVAFESAASLGVEATEPLKTIPRAIMQSVIISGLFFIICSYTMVLSFHGSNVPLDKCSTPLLSMAEKLGLPMLGHFVDAGIMVSFFAAALANLTAASRMILKMSHDGIFHASFGKAHKENCTPHLAIFAASGVSLSIALVLAMFNCQLLDIVGWLGTTGTFGFIFGYLITSISAGKLLKRTGKLNAGKMLIVFASCAVLTLSLIGSVYPAPAFPYNLLPVIFGAYMIVGLIFSLKSKPVKS